MGLVPTGRDVATAVEFWWMACCCSGRSEGTLAVGGHGGCGMATVGGREANLAQLVLRQSKLAAWAKPLVNINTHLVEAVLGTEGEDSDAEKDGADEHFYLVHPEIKELKSYEIAPPKTFPPFFFPWLYFKLL
ncbi:hypothetical protein QYF36_002990 [Acer negundo]|nr:hypothetical protein QYF36_002990 [Acer negundo]